MQTVSHKVALPNTSMPHAKKELLWQDKGACREVENADNLFFPPAGDAGPKVNAAKAICAQCPVKKPCLDYAIKYRVQGVWGGETERDRNRIRSLLGIRGITPQLV